MTPRNEVSVFIRAKDLASKVVKGFDRNLKAVRRTARNVAVSIGGMVAAVVGLEKLVERGGKVVGVQRSFERVTGDSTVAILKLQKASKGLINDYELMVGFNKALALGAADNVDQFGDLLKASQDLSRALGIDAAFAMEKFSLGLARQSPKLLDDVGIKVSAKKANEDYAASIDETVAQLTDEQRSLAFRSAALKEADRLVQQLGGSEIAAADAVGQFNAMIQNSVDRIAGMLAQSPAVMSYFQELASLAEIFLGGDPISRAIRESVASIKPEFVAAAAKKARAEVKLLKVEVEKANTAAGGKLRLGGLTEELKQAETRLAALGDRLRAINALGRKDREKDGGGEDEAAPAFARTASVDDSFFSELVKKRDEASKKVRALQIDLVALESQLVGMDQDSEPFKELNEKAKKLRDGLAKAREEAEALQKLARETGLSTIASFDIGRPGAVGAPLLAAPGRVAGLGAGAAEIARALKGSGLTTEQLGEVAPDQLKTLKDAAGLAGQSLDEFLESMTQGSGGLESAGDIAVDSFSRMAQAAISGSGQMEAVVSQSFNRIIQSLQGKIGGGGFLGGLLGAGLGVAGGLIASKLFGGSRSNPLPVTIQKFDSEAERQLKNQNTGPENVTVQIISSSTGEVLSEVEYQLGRRARRDGVVRIPGGATLTGLGG